MYVPGKLCTGHTPARPLADPVAPAAVEEHHDSPILVHDGTLVLLLKLGNTPLFAALPADLGAGQCYPLNLALHHVTANR